jgi:hypothetical protein
VRDTVPPDLAGFVIRHIRSLEDLQVLMTCIESRDRWWDAAAMNRELGIGGRAARQSLDRLAQGNLLDIRITGDVRYQFNPGTAALEAAALACASEYHSNPVALVRMVARSTDRSIQDFADAFRFQKKGRWLK